MRSVYFYTFHKCASSLFADYVLQHVHGLTHVDYSGRRFLEGSAGEVCFEPQGYVYGPIRVLATLREARWESAVCVPEFVRDKRAIFMVRDPRDLLVSQYYSTAFSHAISPVPEIRDRQLEARRRALRASVDAFALKRAGAMARKFDLLGRLAESCEDAVQLRYEDMIDDWQAFSAGLTRHLALGPQVLAELHARSRPRESEDVSAHQRSGKPQGFREKLSPSTVRALERTLAPVLRRFGYSS